MSVVRAVTNTFRLQTGGQRQLSMESSEIAWRISVILVRLCFASIRAVDGIMTYFGYQIFKVNPETVFHGLAIEELEAAMDPAVATPLRLYLEGFQGVEGAYKMGGLLRLTQRLYLRRVLNTRAGTTKAIKDHPDVLKTPVKRPLFIIGFPRTGTTLLYNLLAQDPQFKAPMLWELIKPYPPGRPDNWRNCQRYKSVKQELQLYKLTGQLCFNVAHELEVENPEECLFALERNFLHYGTHLRLPSFSRVADWYYSLTKDELVNVYHGYKKTLQLIGYKGLDNHRLLLKSHVHLMMLDALLEVFPDACLVFTYRPMTEVLPSFCSMVYKATDVWGPIDAEYGKRVVRMLGEFANRAVHTMKQYDNVPKEKQPFYNVEYNDLVKDPIEVIRGIYDRYGLDLLPEVEQRMRTWLHDNRQHKHGRHTYSMEEYGLTEEDIKSNMGPYLDYFKNQSHNLI